MTLDNIFFYFWHKKEYDSKMISNFCHFHFSVDWANLVFQKVDFIHGKWLLSFISYITFIVIQSVLFQSICIVSFLRYLNFNVVLYSCLNYFLWELRCSYGKFRKKQTTYLYDFLSTTWIELLREAKIAFWNLSTWHQDLHLQAAEPIFFRRKFFHSVYMETTQKWNSYHYRVFFL